MTRKHVVVVGSGIAGLASAWHLSSKSENVRVTILEASNLLGGKIKTTDFSNQRVDVGPDSFLNGTPALSALLSELGLSNKLIRPKTSKTYIYLNGHLNDYPLGTVLGVPSNFRSLLKLISPQGALRAGLDLILPRMVGRSNKDQSVGKLIRSRLGNEIADNLIDPLVGGINSSSIDNLSLECITQINQLSKSNRSLIIAANKAREAQAKSRNAGAKPSGSPVSPFVSLEGGLGVIIEALVDELREDGVAMQWNQPVVTISNDKNKNKWNVQTKNETLQCDGVIIATPAKHSALILNDLSSRASTILDSIRYASIAVVRMAINRDDITHPLDGSGFVVPANQNLHTTACTWSSSKWDHLSNTDKALFRISTGRFSDQRHVEMPDDVLAKVLGDELAQILGSDPTTFNYEFDVTRWDQAMTQYEPGHKQKIERVRGLLREFSTIQLAGSSFDGGGIPACVESGVSAAKRLIGEL